LAAPLVAPLTAQQTQGQPSSALPASPVARIEITPRTRNVVAGDSIRLQARALDAAGRPVVGARIFFTQRSGSGQGLIDSTGMVIASSVGRMPFQVTAIVPGTRPVIDTTLEIVGVPGPAARVEIGVKAAKLVAGQELRIDAVPFSKANDRAHDRLRWTSSA